MDWIHLKMKGEKWVSLRKRRWSLWSPQNDDEACGLHKTRGISRVAAQRPDFQNRLCSIELVNCKQVIYFERYAFLRACHENMIFGYLFKNTSSILVSKIVASEWPIKTHLALTCRPVWHIHDRHFTLAAHTCQPSAEDQRNKRDGRAIRNLYLNTQPWGTCISYAGKCPEEVQVSQRSGEWNILLEFCNWIPQLFSVIQFTFLCSYPIFYWTSVRIKMWFIFVTQCDVEHLLGQCQGSSRMGDSIIPIPHFIKHFALGIGKTFKEASLLLYGNCTNKH